MLFDQIHNHSILGQICRQTCEENNSKVCIDEPLLSNGILDDNKILILKPDAYYNSLVMHNPPPAIDCLIFVKCTSGNYDMYLIELRDCSGSSRISLKEILPKFDTIVNRFFNEFHDIFELVEHKINSVFLWLVVDPYNTRRLNSNKVNKKILGTVLEQYSSMRPFNIFGKFEIIQPKLPSHDMPSPIIAQCH